MSSVTSYKDLITRAQEAESNDHFDEATKLYSEAITLEPSYEFPYDPVNDHLPEAKEL
jgi:hypothetical protein